MDDFLAALKHPEYVHILLNPILTYAMPISLAILSFGLLRKRRELQICGLWVIVFVGITAWPTWYFGHQAFDHLLESLTDEAKQWATSHVQRADRFIYVLYVAGSLALVAIYYPRKSPNSAVWLGLIALVAGIVGLASSGWVARAGGEIRHSELRMGPAPTAPEHQHGGNEGHSH